jgi:hypothetical protein
VIEINKIVSLANETKASSRRGGLEGNSMASNCYFYVPMRFDSLYMCANVTVNTFATLN